MTDPKRDNLAVEHERAVLVACLLPGLIVDPQDPLGELRSLADTAGAVVVDELIQNRKKPDPATFIGSGKAKELGEMAAACDAHVVIFDNELSPSQIGKLEKVINLKVLDRSELILDIFATRAKSHEARLQVELAQLEYTYPRLKAMWSHLERIAGGTPVGIGTRGPGEQQLEIDRRIVQRKKSELKRQIATVQGRKAREVEKRNFDYFTVGLVGYTNAGKSTLFNALTEGGAYADDKLFATLSTRTRRWGLGSGDQVMLSDTVGFVRDLPHYLVASFKATLEEAVHSDLLLVVVDAAHPRAASQYRTVTRVLDEIGADRQPRLVVLNKTDLLTDNADLLVLRTMQPDSLAISAATGRGLDELADQVLAAMRGPLVNAEIAIDLADGKSVHFLDSRSQVLHREYEEGKAVLRVLIGSRQLEQLKALGGSARVINSRPVGA